MNNKMYNKKIMKLTIILGIILVIIIYTILLAPIYSGNSYPTRDALAKIDLASELSYLVTKFDRPLSFNLFTYQPVTPYISVVITTIISLVLRNTLIAYAIIVTLWCITGFLGMYILISKLTRNFTLSMIMSIIYVFNICFVNELLRGHTGIIAGYVAFPWVYILLRELVTSQSTQCKSIDDRSSSSSTFKLMLLSIFIALSITSQAYIAVIVATEILAFTIAYFAYLCIKCENVKMIIYKLLRFMYRLTLVLMMSLILSLWYIVPLLITGKFSAIEHGIIVSTSIKYKFRYSENFIDALALLPIYLGDLIKGGTLTSAVYYIESMLVQVVLIYFIFSKLKKNTRNKFDIVSLSLMFIFALTLSLGPRTFIGFITANVLISSAREFYYFIGLAVFAEFSLLSLALQLHSRSRLSKYTTSIMEVFRSVKGQITNIILLILIILQIASFISCVDKETIYIEARHLNDIKTEFKIIGSNYELLDNRSNFIISLPGGWSSIYYTLIQDNTKLTINGLFMASGVLTSKPLMVLNVKSPFILSRPIYGKESLLFNMLYKGFAPSSLSKLLCYLNTKYIILNKYDIFTKNKINRIKSQLESYKYFKEVYSGSNSQLFSLVNCSCASYRLINDIVFFIGSLSSLVEYMSFVSEEHELCNTALIYYSQVLVNRKYNISYILNSSNTIAFASGANYLDLVYLMYKQNIFKYVKSVSSIGNARVITLNKINDFLATHLYKYILTPAYIMYNGSWIRIQLHKGIHQERYILAFKVYIKPQNDKLRIIVDNRIVKTINLGYYPGFGFKWIILNLGNLSSDSNIYISLDGEGNTILDSLILMPKKDYMNIVEYINRLLAKKTVIYVVSPNSYPLVGSNIHVERYRGSADDFVLLVPWHVNHSASFSINSIYIPSNHGIKLTLRTKAYRNYPGKSSKYSYLISLAVNKTSIGKALYPINLTGNYVTSYVNLGLTRKAENCTLSFQTMTKSAQIMIDYIMLILTPEGVHYYNKVRYRVAIEPMRAVLSDKILKIVVKLESTGSAKGNYRALLLPILYNEYVFLRTNNYKIYPVPSLGLTLFILPVSNDTVTLYLCLKDQQYYILSCAISLTALIIIILYVTALSFKRMKMKKL